MLNAEQIIEREVLKLENSLGKPAQIGFDLSLKKVEKILGGVKVLNTKTVIDPNSYEEILTKNVGGLEVWELEKGSFALTFNEGCKIPNNLTGFIIHRSSIMRGGAYIVSALWDPGFETEEMGTTLLVTEKILIEKNSRVAQMYFFENESVSVKSIYKGQFQNKTNY